MHFFELLHSIQNMFEYKCDDVSCETFRSNFLEEYASLDVFATAKMIDDKLWCLPCSISGKVDYNGVGDTVIITAPNYSSTDKIGTIPLLINNSSFTPDYEIFQFAECLTNTVVSENSQLMYSRLFPCPIAKDNVDLIQYETVIRKMLNGDYAPVLSKTKEWIESENKTDMVNFTDNNKVDKIQYLNQHYETLYKRFYNIFGQSIQNTGKLAQSLQDEIHSHDWISFIYPLDKLKQRKKFVNEINKIYGLNMTVEFSEPWRKKYENMLKEADINEIKNEQINQSKTEDSK